MSSKATEQKRRLNVDIAFYYFVVGWELRILTEFDDFIKGIDSAQLQNRYFANYDMFQNTAVWLQNELDEQFKVMGEKGAKMLRTSMNEIIEQLVVEWREQVKLLVERIQKKRSDFFQG